MSTSCRRLIRAMSDKRVREPSIVCSHALPHGAFGGKAKFSVAPVYASCCVQKSFKGVYRLGRKGFTSE